MGVEEDNMVVTAMVGASAINLSENWIRGFVQPVCSGCASKQLLQFLGRGQGIVLVGDTVPTPLAPYQANEGISLMTDDKKKKSN